MAHAFSLHEKWQVIACLKHSVVMQCNANQLQGQFILPKWDWSVIRLKWRTSKVTKKGDFWKSAWQQTYLLHHSEHVWSQFWNEGQATQKPKGEFLKNRIVANLILSSSSLPTISLLSMTWVAFWHYTLQCSCSGWPTGYGKKLSRSQAQLGQATCLAVA